jgi:CBS domain-containing protein
MTQSALWLPETASLGQAAALMALERIHRVPIVSGDGRVVGIISTLDISQWLAEQGGYVVPRLIGSDAGG